MDGGRQRANRADRSDVQDRAFALADHLLVDRFGDGEEAVDVRVYHFIPRAVGCGRKIIAAIDRSVVDEYVNTAPLINELARDALHADAIRHGDFESVSASPVRCDLLRDFGSQVVALVVAESHVRALTREDLAHGCADAARAA